MADKEEEKQTIALIGPQNTGKTAFRKSLLPAQAKGSAPKENTPFQFIKKLSDKSICGTEIWEYSIAQQKDLNLIKFYLKEKDQICLFIKADDARKNTFDDYKPYIEAIKSHLSPYKKFTVVVTDKSHTAEGIDSKLATWLKNQGVSERCNWVTLKSFSPEETKKVSRFIDESIETESLYTDDSENESSVSDILTAETLINKLCQDLSAYSEKNSGSRAIRQTALKNCLESLRDLDLDNLMEAYTTIRASITEKHSPLKKLTHMDYAFEFFTGPSYGKSECWRSLLSKIKQKITDKCIEDPTEYQEKQTKIDHIIDQHNGTLQAGPTDSRLKLDNALSIEPSDASAVFLARPRI